MIELSVAGMQSTNQDVGAVRRPPSKSEFLGDVDFFRCSLSRLGGVRVYLTKMCILLHHPKRERYPQV